MGKLWLVISGFHVRKNLSKIIRNLDTSLQERSSKRLTLYLLTSRIWWAPNNASKGQIGFNLASKGLENIGLTGDQIISLAGTPTCVRLAPVPNWSGPDIPIQFLCPLKSPCTTMIPPHSKELSPFWEPDSHSTDQNIILLVIKPKVHRRLRTLSGITRIRLNILRSYFSQINFSKFLPPHLDLLHNPRP
jgi:hypothetical protein